MRRERAPDPRLEVRLRDRASVRVELSIGSMGSRAKDEPRVRVEPVTAERLADFEQLFSSRGAPHYCWCAVYRLHVRTNRANSPSATR